MPQGFSIGPLNIHFYGILIMVGAIAAAWVAAREARRRGINPELVWDCLPWALIGGVIGARLWHVFTPPTSNVAMGLTTHFYLTHPLEILAVWKGGLGIPGGVIGGALALEIYARRKGMSFAIFGDMVAPGLALAQAIGRWGNFVNQEVYGAPSNLPWAIFIEPQYRIKGFADIAYYHPLFLYESIWNLLNMGFLLWMGRRYARQLKTGDLFIFYVFVYSIGRFFLEYLRLDPSHVAGINFNQMIMALLAVGSALLLYRRHASGKEAPSSD